MSQFPFSPPAYPELAWDPESKLFRHYNTLLVGKTIYKNGTGWHTATEGYDPVILEGATDIYYGGRDYVVDFPTYLDLIAAGFVPDPILEGLYPGGYPGLNAFPAPEV